MLTACLQYGLIYHSTFIGRAGPKYKGRISRFLANKCSIASRIDCYTGTSPTHLSLLVCSYQCSRTTDHPTAKFGEVLRQQVEERLTFFETGEAPSKNADAMRKALDAIALEDGDESDDEMQVDGTGAPALPLLEPSPKKDKKKKRKSADADMDVDESEAESPKKKAKLSKEEKKALKKEKKKAHKEAEAAEVSPSRLKDACVCC